MRHYASHGGVGILVLLLLAFLVLSYFNIDLESVLKKPEVAQGVQALQQQSAELYTPEIQQQVHTFWNDIVVNIIWKNFIENLKSGGTQMIQTSIDQLNQPVMLPTLPTPTQ